MKKIIKLMSVVCVAAIVMLCATSCGLFEFLFGDEGQILPPDYPPMETDPNQEKIDGDETVPPSQSGGSITISYTPTVTVDLSDKTISFSYANTQSNQNVVLRLSVADTLLGESATINPGNKLTTMTLNDDAAAKLQVGGYDGVFVVGFYNVDTNEKSMVDTRLEVTVNVQE